MTSKLETELVKATGFKPPKGGYDDRQDHLAALARKANDKNVLDDDAFDELTDDAANWVTAAIHSIRDKEEIKDFDDAEPEDESTDETDTEDSAEDGSEEADDGAEPGGDETDPEADAEAESENEAEEAAADAKARKAPKAKAVGSKSARSTKPASRQKAEPEEAPKKKERITTTRYDNIDGSKDKFGLVIGTKTWEAVQMYEKGTTTAEIKEKLGGRYYNILKILEERGHRVERFPGGKFKVTHSTDRKRKVKE